MLLSPYAMITPPSLISVTKRLAVKVGKAMRGIRMLIIQGSLHHVWCMGVFVLLLVQVQESFANDLYYKKDVVLQGMAKIIDGDSLVISGKEVRLQGIDAMEYHQQCYLEGKPWSCGQQADAFLRSYAQAKEMTCYVQDKDKYGRLISVCFVAGKDVAESLVEEGYAVALPWFSDFYVFPEKRAKRQKKNIWRGTFERPATWRRKNRR